MNESTTGAVRRAIEMVLREIVDGARPESGWLLNPGDAGLLRSLDSLSATQASALPGGGGASIAAHVEHLRYGLELLHRWSRGEDAFGDADWGASWRRTTVTDDEWRALRDGLRKAAARWRDGFGAPVDAGEDGLTTVIASVAHLAYHLGAIRQIDRAARGPAERG